MTDPTQDVTARLHAEMAACFGASPDEIRIVRAPYRICPLGAHIDHQLGVVTGMAIDQGLFLAYSPSRSSLVTLRSLAFSGTVRFSLDNIPPPQPGDWGNYARGAAFALRSVAALRRGLLGITVGRLAEGGLSSSASIGLAYLLALADVNGLELSAADSIRLDQLIESCYLGLHNGILDQATILLSRPRHLTIIDCRAFAENPPAVSDTSFPFGIRLSPCPASTSPFVILLAFSGLNQSLVSTAYNRRVDECAQAAAILLQAVGRVAPTPLLGYLTETEYQTYRDRLSGPPACRAEHFFTEMQRVRRGIVAWEQGDLRTLGRLMSESGRSSIDNYECGCQPLIDLYQILIQTPGVYGARFSGAGFRGCCVALADPAAAPNAAPGIQAAYADRQPDLAKNASVLFCQPEGGARIL